MAADPIDERIQDTHDRIGYARSAWEKTRWERELTGLRLSKAMALPQFFVDLDRLPRVVMLRKRAGLASFFLYVALFFFVITGIPWLIIVGLNEPDTPLYAYTLVSVGPLVSGAAIIWCVARARYERQYRFDEGGVAIERRSLLRSDSAYLRYPEFSGIVLRESNLNTRYHQRTYYIVELMHDHDPAPLHIGTNLDRAQQAHADYARRLQLVAL